jgi:hypothetical protein
MGGFTVLAKAFPVVRRHQDERLPVGSTRLETVEQPAELGVDVGDLAVVGTCRESLGERLRGPVVVMGIVVVHP